jgi:hypothetical protein
MEICNNVLEDGPDGERAKLLSDMVLAKKSDAFGVRQKRAVSGLLQVLIAVQDKGIAMDFWNQYLSQEKEQGRVPHAVLPMLKSFLSKYGTSAQSTFVSTAVSRIALKKFSNRAFGFVAAAVKVLAEDYSTLRQELIHKLVQSIGHEGSIDDESVKTFFEMVQAHASTIFVDPSRIVVSFLNALTELPCRTRGGSMLLIGTNLSNVDWKGIETPLLSAINKLKKEGYILHALKMVKELAGPIPKKLDCRSNKYKLCATLANQVLHGSLSALMDAPTVHQQLDLLYIADAFCHNFVQNIAQSVGTLNIDEYVTPICLSLCEHSNDSPSFRQAADELALRIVPILNERVSTPLGDVTNWATSVTAETHFEKKQIDEFLASPCHGSLSFELAKHSHERILADLKPLMSSGYINAYPSRLSGKGRWRIKIDKLKSKKQPLESAISLSCTCLHWRDDCLRNSSAAKLQEVEDARNTLAKIESCLGGMIPARNKRARAGINSMAFSRKKQGNGSGRSSHDAIVID